MGMKLSWQSLKALVLGSRSSPPTQGLDLDLIKEMARAIAATQSDEIGCDECFEQMDEFVDMTLAGKDAAQAMPLVQDHLDRCSDCREEFEALLAAVSAAG